MAYIKKKKTTFSFSILLKTFQLDSVWVNGRILSLNMVFDVKNNE